MKEKLLHNAPGKGGLKARLAISQIVKFSVALFLLMVTNGQIFAQTNYIQAPPTANGTSGANRGPNGSVDFQRSSILYLGSEVVGLPPGAPITRLGFSIATAATTAATGNIKIYMVNTADASYSRGTSWASIISTPTAMTLVYDGPMTIPATAGYYDVALTTPFAYTGGNFYLAYEWNATTKSTGSAVYNTNSVNVINGLVTGTGTTAPASLTATSSFRPVLRLGFTPPANDLNVAQVYSLGKLPNIPAVLPHVVQAAIINTGSNTQTNATVTLNITGANTFITTATITTLAANDTIIVSFPGFTPTATGANTITVSVGADGNNSNNSKTYAQIVTTDAISYAEGASPAHSTALRPIAPFGTLLAKFHVNASQSITIPSVNLLISFHAANPGNTVYAVIMDAAGNLVGRSADYVIQTADLSTLKNFVITNPPTLNNTDYYVGMAVIAGATTYFPLGVQNESPVRPNTFFTGPLSGGAAPTPLTSQYRLIVEPILVPVTGTDLEVVAFTSPVSGCALTNTEQVCIIIKNNGATAIIPSNNLPVSLTINGGAPINEVFTGTLAPGASTTFCFTATANLTVAGSYTLIASVNHPSDNDPTNNSKTITVNSSPVGTVTAANVSRCGPGSVTITPTATNANVFAYFAAATGGNEITTGNSFQTPNLTANTTYYVEASQATFAGNAGPTNNTIGAGGFGNFSNITVFNALVPLRIDSVKLYSNGPLTLTIGVTDTTSKARIDSVTVSLPGAGEHMVYVGLDVPTGTGYGLGVFSFGAGTGMLFRNTAGAAYPYTLPGVVSITGSNFQPQVRYYYFYDWSVSTRGCTTARVPVQVTINPLPTVNAGAALSICADASAITLSGATPAGGTWSGNGVTAAGVFTPSATLVGSQTLTYTYTDPATTCTNTATRVVTVNALPTVSAGASISVCANASALTLTGATPAGGTWSGSGVTSAGVFTPSSALVGNQTLTYTYTNPSTSCTNTATRIVTVSALPTVNAGASVSFCSNNAPATLTGATPAGGTWSGNGVSTTGVFTPSASLTGNQTLTYTYTDPATNCFNTSTRTVTVIAAPATPTISQSGFTLTSSAATGNQWYLNGTAITGATAQSFSVTTNGNYTVIATANGCSSATSAMLTINNVGISEDAAGMHAMVYPNPASGSFFVTLKKADQPATVKLITLTGQEILTETVSGNAAKNIKTRNIAAGTYLVKIITDKGTQVSRLVIQ